jgi:hypothetical protein
MVKQEKKAPQTKAFLLEKYKRKIVNFKSQARKNKKTKMTRKILRL